jgi:hypothetical protein
MNGDGIPELSIGDRDAAIAALLSELQRAALVHPEAARALFTAMVREGRLYAKTEAGRRWHEKLLASDLLERANLVWQSTTLWVTENADQGATPSALADSVATAASSGRREQLLSRLFEAREGET